MKLWYKYIIAFTLIVLVVVCPLLWFFRVEVGELLSIAKVQAEFLGKINPMFLIVAIGILPAVGVPSSIFYIIGSIAYGVVWGLIYSGIGVAINISLTYWLANSILRVWIVQFLEKRGHKILTIPPAEVKSAIIAIRLMPGLPLSVQNYILGVSGVAFKPYFLLSWPTQMFWAVFFILVANTVLQQTAESIILVLLGIIVIALLIKVIRGVASSEGREDAGYK